LPTSGGSSHGTGVTHIHNLGAVFIGEGGKAASFGSIFVGAALYYSLEHGAICPEIAGRSSAEGAEPLRLLPFGAVGT